MYLTSIRSHGRPITADMENLKVSLDVHKIKNGFALVIVNEKYKYHQFRRGAHADRENITDFCEKAGLTVNNIDGLGLTETSALPVRSSRQTENR